MMARRRSLRTLAALGVVLAALGMAWQTSPAKAPQVVSIPIPDFRGTWAIWGSLGRDSSGHVWFGVSMCCFENPSARLFEYVPETGVLTERGDVVSQLKRTGVYRQGEGQAKIHSRIVQAADGYMYFASMDEADEHTDGSRLPTWGGHLWRVKPGSNLWEHLFATPEALIAVSGSGNLIYALGYFDHVLYQFDTTTRRVRSVHVGALGGHISRNFVTDDRGHAYVTRLANGPAPSTTPRVTLVELNTALQVIGETPIDHYSITLDDDSHGIIGIQTLPDRSIVIATDRGYLYRITPQATGAAKVEALGFFHPQGEAYVASLFMDPGGRHLMGASRRGADNRYEWLVYDLAARTAVVTPLTIPPIAGEPPKDLLLYGSMVRDNSGRAYLAGTFKTTSPPRELPVVLQVQDGAR